jgi:hypothetical protein
MHFISEIILLTFKYIILFFKIILPDVQLNLLGIVPNEVCHSSSLSIFSLGHKTISRRAARRLIVLHPKQNIKSELKWQTG